VFKGKFGLPLPQPPPRIGRGDGREHLIRLTSFAAHAARATRRATGARREIMKRKSREQEHMDDRVRRQQDERKERTRWLRSRLPLDAKQTAWLQAQIRKLEDAKVRSSESDN
jgi:hypothetical protein